MKHELALSFERLGSDRFEIGLYREATALTGGQIVLEVEGPVARVRPASAPFRALRVALASNGERVGEMRIAERDDRLAEARGDLAHAFRFTSGREKLDLGRSGSTARGREYEEKGQRTRKAAPRILIVHAAPFDRERNGKPRDASATVAIP
jgi:hypothetical protein